MGDGIETLAALEAYYKWGHVGLTHTGVGTVVQAVKGASKSELVVIGAADNLFTTPSAAIHSGALRARDAKQLVDNVIARAKGTPIERLEIIDHGEPGCQKLNGAPLCSYSKGKFWMAPELAALKGKFAPGAVLTLGGCSVGEGEDGKRLLAMLAKELCVTVRAGEAEQRPPPGLEGPVVQCSADGECTRAWNEALLPKANKTPALPTPAKPLPSVRQR